MATEGFFPRDLEGDTKAYFETYSEALPIATFALSLVGGALGMTKTLLSGPLSVLPKTAPVAGMVSINFLCVLFLNLMFAFRLLAIEAMFFSSYFLINGDKANLVTHGTINDEIPATLPAEYRLLMYLLPAIISILVNAIKMAFTYRGLGGLLLRHPHFALAPGFSPFMFEGVKVVGQESQYSLRIWKMGTLFNAIFMGIMPHISLIVADFGRGVTAWPFFRDDESVWEINNALIKSPYGNVIFSATALVLFTFIIPMTLLNDRIFPSCQPCILPNSLNDHPPQPSEVVKADDEHDDDGQLQTEGKSPNDEEAFHLQVDIKF